MSPESMARDAFLASKEGVQCIDGSTSGAYLKNRIVIAFEAGVEAGKKIGAAKALARYNPAYRRLCLRCCRLFEPKREESVCPDCVSILMAMNERKKGL